MVKTRLWKLWQIRSVHLTLDSTNGVSQNGQMFPRCYFCNLIWCHWNDTAAFCLINVSVFNSFCPHRGQNPGHTLRAAAHRGPRPRVTAAQLRAIDNLIRAVGGRGTPALNVCPATLMGPFLHCCQLTSEPTVRRNVYRQRCSKAGGLSDCWPVSGEKSSQR